MDGHSLHAHTGIVAPSNFDNPGTAGTTKGVFYNDKQAMETNISSTIFTEAQSIPATHSLVKDNFALMEEQIKQALQHDVNALPKEAPPPPHPASTDPSLDPAPTKINEMLSSLVKITKEGTKGAQRLQQYTDAKNITNSSNKFQRRENYSTCYPY